MEAPNSSSHSTTIESASGVTTVGGTRQTHIQNVDGTYVEAMYVNIHKPGHEQKLKNSDFMTQKSDVLNAPTFLRAPAAAPSSLLSVLTKQITDFEGEETVKIKGHVCSYSTKMDFYRFEVVWNTDVRCSSWTHIVGKGKGKSRNGSLKHAIEHFMDQLRLAGLITEEEIATTKSENGHIF